MSLPIWATTKETKELFGRACAYKAPPEILSDYDACEAYVNTTASLTAGTAGGSTGVPSRNSTNIGRSVYILLANGFPIGTAFAVRCDSLRMLLTAYHCIFNEKGHLIKDELSITAKIMKDSSNAEVLSLNSETRGSLIEGVNSTKVRVRVHSYDKVNDWALLKLDRPYKFKFEYSIPLCPASEIPESIVCQPEFSIFHCPCEEYNAIRQDALEATSTGDMKAKTINLLTKKMTFYGGLTSGSSGGVIVDSYGRAVAMHVDADNREIQVPNILTEEW
eukprot:CAMPEP_0196764928 /NCGR_PEP_ID=MMETSP1095-20130614/7182_1 /TAXON_ID=96789 ORGANISM="Chromulina nebulosa, Strain UTEXLB2642" /NCGR_SAMPLE_ID=MMETSP1095 /ASSEMBLY_ACC=CAM_ASM_000446 /LENGTH=276 /DNA_ID=CAMNT_0042121789 /DNA_START=18 /DNA_END=845 /DNA_ORIENTATION=-